MISSLCRSWLAAIVLLSLASRAYAELPDAPQPQVTQGVPSQTSVPQSSSPDSSADQSGQTNDEQVKKAVHQRILGVMPNFNSVEGKAVPLTAKQKFKLAFRTSTDPFTFALTGVVAAFGQAQDSYPEYGQGLQGYGKRWGAGYADAFDGNILGNALFPVLLHQDPRYYRLGEGSFKKRLVYAVMTTVRCRGDNGKWQGNYSNILGNLAAGGISNLYYPASDRGAGLTIERGFTVTAEGAFGAVLIEFWPDISRHLRHHKQTP